MPRSDPSPRKPPCPGCGRIPQARGEVNFCPGCGAALQGDDAGAAAAGHPWVGRVVADRYRLISLLGEGGMGAVYKAEHIRMGKALALKVLRSDFAAEPGAAERFREEARIVSRLSSPHTIGVFDFGQIAGGDRGLYLAMEYVPGKDLATLLREEERIPAKRAAVVGAQVLGALSEAHAAGIVHRDIKPANVMLMEPRPGEDFAKVLDFGIAKLRGDTTAAAATGETGTIVGTPSYLAPEQARGEAIDARADLYSMGALLYEAVAGRCPFVAPTPMAVVAAHLADDPPPLLDLAPEVSPAFATVVHRALAKRPEDRFPSADAMREALLLAVTDGPAPAPRRTRAMPRLPEVTGELRIASREDFEKLDRQIRALRRGRLAAPLLLLALAAGAAAAAWRWSDLYAFAGRELPALLPLLPATFRPAGYYDGEEHEPNDTPAQANALPFQLGGEAPARIEGAVGARISDAAGDVDVYRVEVPAGRRTRAALVAEWTAADGRDGLRGLDVALALNRDRGGAGARRSAPLVASADRGGPGRPERLVAAVEPGTYWLSVRERHAEGEWPVELPEHRYALRVRLADPRPDEEVEPNDAPAAAELRALRYPEWRALAEQNPLIPGVPLRGQTSPEDPDTLAFAAGVAARAEHATSAQAILAEEGPAGLVAVVPGPNLALRAHVWTPDREDLAPRGPDDRVRFERAGEAGPGEVLLVRVDRADAPLLLQLRAAAGEGEYAALALVAGGAPDAALALFRSLEAEGRLAQALELAAGAARLLPGSRAAAALADAAGDLAARAAPGLPSAALPRFARASELLAAPIFEATSVGLRYTGAFAAYAPRRK